MRYASGISFFSMIFIAASPLFSQGTFQGAYYEKTPGRAQDVRIPVNTTTVGDVLHSRLPAAVPASPAPAYGASGPATAYVPEAPISVPKVMPRASQASYEQPISKPAPANPTNPTVETAMRAPSAMPDEAEKPTIKQPAETDSLLAFQEVVTTPSGTYQQITIIDSKMKSMCVYHIDMTTGQIELRSARDLQWDLQLNYLNTKKPLPSEVRGILLEAKK